MDQFQLLPELRKGEGQMIEFKESFSSMDAIAETIASFSKLSGTIYVGVADDGSPKGVECSKRIKDQLYEIATIISPQAKIDIEIIPYDNKHIARIFVHAGNGDTYIYKNRAIERDGARNRILSIEEVLQRKINSSDVQFGDLPAKTQDRPAYIADINGNLLLEYLETAQKERGKGYNFQNVKQTLANLGLLMIDGIQVTYNAILMFGKDPQKFLPNSVVHIAVYEGLDKTSKFIRFTAKGTLPNLIDDTLLILNRYIRRVSKIQGIKRIEVVEYPEEALREGLVNAIAHRDYWHNTPEVFVDFYKDRIEIINPATFPYDRKSFNEIKEQGLSVRRNKKIAELLDDIGLMDRRGRGLQNLKKIMLDHGLREPSVIVTDNFLKLVLYGVEGDIFSLAKTAGVETDLSELSERQMETLKRIDEIGTISSKEYADHFGGKISQKQAQRDLKDLVNRKLLMERGKGPNRRYGRI